ncbi:MAG: TIGR00159 family protein [Clostridia bacterium]|nr:TIGR00159 family protein [Clostridia bacterium]
MKDNFYTAISDFWQINIINYIQNLSQNPLRIISLILDLTIVIFLIYKLLKTTKNSRVWQLIKGIALLIILTAVSGWIHLDILHYILTSVMTYGVIVMIVIFQPELRRALEQLGTNKFTKFFGMDKDIITKTKEDIYKIVIAVLELSKAKTGALIVIERDIKIGDIAETGIEINAEISPQLLVNIFEPKTPLHDGAVVISNNKIKAAACILPLVNDKQTARKLGTRHRAAIGISKETDSIVVVVSEETGKISIAKDGTLIADVTEEVLKKILIKNIITNRLVDEKKIKSDKLNKLKSKFKTKK